MRLLASPARPHAQSVQVDAELRTLWNAHEPRAREAQAAQTRAAVYTECRRLGCNLANTRCRYKKERRRSAALSMGK